MSDTLLQIRIDGKLKKNSEAVLMAMGLKLSEAVRVFLQQTVNDQALPFWPSTGNHPNKKTLKAFGEIEKKKYSDSSLKGFKKSLKI